MFSLARNLLGIRGTEIGVGMFMLLSVLLYVLHVHVPGILCLRPMLVYHSVELCLLIWCWPEAQCHYIAERNT